MNKNLGIIFHWGLYSVPAYDDIKSARRRKTQNGSEWYLKRLKETGNYRPISGWEQTQKYHKENYKDLEYEDFQKMFNPEDWNPDEWMHLAKEIGASYVILTSRHHDGYCLWPTKTTKYHSERDLVGEFISSARKFGLKAGIYYSWIEFGKSFTIKYIQDTVEPQINELKKYKPDIWWFDGHWDVKTEFAKRYVDSVCQSLKKENPNIEINDRLYKSDELGCATYKVYEDRYIPSEIPKVPWEHINTIGLSWGRNTDQKEEDYKTGEELFKLYEKVRKLNGRFLINLGPEENGKLDKFEVNSLLNFGKLLESKQNEEESEK